MRLRFILGVPLVAAALGAAAIGFAYGEIEPCRVLAVEQARRAHAAITGLPVQGILERWARLNTSQMSSGACITSLLDSWGERASGASR